MCKSTPLLVVAIACLLTLPVRAESPAGVRVHRSTALSTSLLIPWGSTRGDIAKILAPRVGLRPEVLGPLLTCETNRCDLSGEWLTDFGGDRLFRSPVLFIGKRGLYRFGVLFVDDSYDFVRGALVAALGEPKTTTTVPMQNAFGAEFLAQVSTWDTEDFSVDLSVRAVRADQGALTVTWKSLAPAVRSEDGAAPF